MGDMFRSEEMALCQMFIQPEAAYTSAESRGEEQRGEAKRAK